MSFINEKRLINYPRIIAVIFIIVFVGNNLFRQGWRGGIGGYISYDFLTYYAVGKVYWSDVNKLYDPETLIIEQEKSFYPTSLDGGWNLYSGPPYLAFYSGILSLIPYDTAYYIWTIFNIFCILLAAFLLNRYFVTTKLHQSGLSTFQLGVIILSLFPVIFGLILGQNHGLTLLLVSGILVCSIREKWACAGTLAGMLLYKPHYVVGFLVIWLAWRKFRALGAFTGVALIWFLPVLLTAGFDPYLDYLRILPNLVTIPLGAGNYLEMTPYALLLNIFSIRALKPLVTINQITIIAAMIGIAWVAYRQRNLELEKRKYIYVLALLFPFIASPHMLIHDVVLLIPLFILWADLPYSKYVLCAAICTYFSFLLIPFITYATDLPLLALIPVVILILFLRDYIPEVGKPIMSKELDNGI